MVAFLEPVERERSGRASHRAFLSFARILGIRERLLKSKKISVEHALHVAPIHSQQGFRPRYVFNYPLSLYYSMHKKIDLHQIRANF